MLLPLLLCIGLPLLLCIGLLSPRGFVEVKIVKLVTLGSLDPRRCSSDLLWSTPFVASGAFCGGARPFVAAWELPILLWVVPQVCCKGLDFRPKGNQ